MTGVDLQARSGPRRLVRTGLVALAAASVLLVGSMPAGAIAQRYPVRGLSTLSVIGHGYGHGRGMSQWGAYGAATAGLTYAQILAFYYTGTTLSAVADPSMRVLISADNDNSTKVIQSSGLSVCSSTRHRTALSSSSSVSSWRFVRSGGALRLQWYSAGAYHYSKLSLPGTYATFTKSTSCDSYGATTMLLGLPSGAQQGIRGGIRAVLYGTGLRTVGAMRMTSYLASVVPSEMPSGWATEALKAQSVAARSYAERYRQVSGGASHSWDICDTTACQVFHGTSAETPATNSAVAATAGRVLTYQGTLALTEFSANDGGWTTAGSSSTPYLVAKADPYDGRVTAYGSWANPHTWTDSISAASIQSRYPSIGTLVRLDVVARDGHGDFGGRTSSVLIQGNAGHATVSGSTFASLFGLKSIWWSVRYAGLNTDLTNDGRPDLVVRDKATGALRINPFTGTSLVAGGARGSGWGMFDQVVDAGDLTGDFTPDLVGRVRTTGQLLVYPGDAAGWVSAGQPLGTGSAYGVLAAAGDFSGDGHADLVGVSKTTHQLMLLRGNGAGALAAPVAIGTGWDVMDTILALGDINGDGYADLLARVHSDGQLRFYYGNGHGGFLTWRILPGSYSGLAMLAVPGDLTGDSRVDLVGVSAATGQLMEYAGTSSGFAAGTVLNSALDWRSFDLMM
jgi:stage II sporulation protein D